VDHAIGNRCQENNQEGRKDFFGKGRLEQVDQPYTCQGKYGIVASPFYKKKDLVVIFEKRSVMVSNFRLGICITV
jgi:hypothetical protein